MPRSLRFTAFEFDPSKYDAMLSEINNLDDDTLTAITGLSSVRAVRTLANRMMVMSNYDSIQELDSVTDAHRSIFAGMAQYITGQPLVRSGEIVGVADGKTQISDIGFMRFVRVCFDDSKWDAIKSYMDSELQSIFGDVAGFGAIRAARLREGSSEGKPAMLVAAAYENQASAEAAMATAQKALGGVAASMTDEPLIRQGDLVWKYRTPEDIRLRG